jgi:hypothetical protein
MSIANVTESGDLTLWFDGLPSTNLENSATTVNNFTFWFDGLPYSTPMKTETTNNTNGGFFLYLTF